MLSFKNNKIHQSIYDELIRVAKRRETITYKQLGDLLGIPHEHDTLGRHLGPVSEATEEAYGFMISVIVVRADQTQDVHGIGLYNLAFELGKDLSNVPQFVQNELDKIYAYYQGHDS